MPLAVKQESIKESFKLLKSNRILLLVSLSSILGAIGFGSSLVTYFFKYKITEDFINLPFIGALGMSTIFFTITSAPTFIAMLLVDKLKKICKDSFVLLRIAVQIICAVFYRSCRMEDRPPYRRHDVFDADFLYQGIQRT